MRVIADRLAGVNDEVYINAAPDSEGAAKGVLVEEVFHLVEESALGL